jgi:hypothetical protein
MDPFPLNSVVPRYISGFDDNDKEDEIYLRRRPMLYSEYRGTLSEERKRVMRTVMKLQEAVCDSAYRELEVEFCSIRIMSRFRTSLANLLVKWNTFATNTK